MATTGLSEVVRLLYGKEEPELRGLFQGRGCRKQELHTKGNYWRDIGISINLKIDFFSFGSTPVSFLAFNIFLKPRALHKREYLVIFSGNFC